MGYYWEIDSKAGNAIMKIHGKKHERSPCVFDVKKYNYFDEGRFNYCVHGSIRQKSCKRTTLSLAILVGLA